MAKPDIMVRIGNFLFRHRNWLFPLFILAVFLIAPPPTTIFGSHRNEQIKDGVAIAMVVAGLALRGVVIGFRYIKRGGVQKKVYAADLVTAGMFGVSRNPLYVGNMLVYAGVFVMHGNPIVAVIGIVAFFIAYQCIIRAEEAYLRDKFGPGYDAYCADVPRWGLKLSRFKESTEGMRFNFGRVILNDYSTIANAAMMLAITELYEHLTHDDAAGRMQAWVQFGWIVGVSILSVVVIVAYKKRDRFAGMFSR